MRTSEMILFAGVVFLALCALAMTFSAFYRDANMIAAFKSIDRSIKDSNEKYSIVFRRADSLDEKMRLLEYKQFSDAGRCHPYLESLIANVKQREAPEIPLDLIRRMVWLESRCLPWAVSTENAEGLMGVRTDAAQTVGYDPGALLDPETNLCAGLAYLRAMIALSGGDMVTALTRYHWGPTRFKSGITTGEYARALLSGKAKK